MWRVLSCVSGIPESRRARCLVHAARGVLALAIVQAQGCGWVLDKVVGEPEETPSDNGVQNSGGPEVPDSGAPIDAGVDGGDGGSEPGPPPPPPPPPSSCEVALQQYPEAPYTDSLGLLDCSSKENGPLCSAVEQQLRDKLRGFRFRLNTNEPLLRYEASKSVDIDSSCVCTDRAELLEESGSIVFRGSADLELGEFRPNQPLVWALNVPVSFEVERFRVSEPYYTGTCVPLPFPTPSNSEEWSAEGRVEWDSQLVVALRLAATDAVFLEKQGAWDVTLAPVLTVTARVQPPAPELQLDAEITPCDGRRSDAARVVEQRLAKARERFGDATVSELEQALSANLYCSGFFDVPPASAGGPPTVVGPLRAELGSGFVAGHLIGDSAELTARREEAGFSDVLAEGLRQQLAGALQLESGIGFLPVPADVVGPPPEIGKAKKEL